MNDDDGNHQAKGGNARAASLTKERRSEIARNAANAKWDETIPRATHAGVLNIGGSELSCYVLSDGTRIFSTRAIMKSLKRSWRGRKYGGTDLPVFLEAKNLKAFISNDLTLVLTPIVFRTDTGIRSEGFRAEILPTVCDIYLKARSEGNVLTAPQLVVAQQCEILMRGFARVGIVALVDEATGYQYERPRRDLEDQLKKFISESLRKWVRTFPADYFKHLCRLRGVELRADMKLPQYFGKLTNNLVYRRLAPGLVKKLKEKRNELGTSSNKLHSWLSADVGFPEVLVHLGTVVGLMKIHTDYAKFEAQLNEVAPIYPEHPGLFDDPKDWTHD